MKTILVSLFLVVILFCPSQAQEKSNRRVNVIIVTDEADAVLSLLAKKQANQEISEEDWKKIFSSEGYVRLKKRELSMKRPFEDADFRAFVLSEALFTRSSALASTLAEWKKTDIDRVAEKPLAYLPASARIRAKIYPVIKPRENSFVFDIPDDPAIFLYLDPTVTKEDFENTFAHELHHIGFGTACPSIKTDAAIKKLPQNTQKVLKWIGAFGEGFAMLAAAGGPDIHPRAVTTKEKRERWDKDMADFNHNLGTVEKFFIDLADGKLSDEDEDKTASSFYGYQGPWYTVGWKMAVVIERTYGRPKLIECMCDQRRLLATYNNAFKKYNHRTGENLSSWSKGFITKLR